MCGLNKIFLAPEVLKMGSKNVVTSKADVYSLGIILYSLIFKDLPLEDDFNSSSKISLMLNDDEDNISQRARFDFSEAQWVCYPEELKEFIMECIEPNVSKRASVE